MRKSLTKDGDRRERWTYVLFIVQFSVIARSTRVKEGRFQVREAGDANVRKKSAPSPGKRGLLTEHPEADTGAGLLQKRFMIGSVGKGQKGLAKGQTAAWNRESGMRPSCFEKWEWRGKSVEKREREKGRYVECVLDRRWDW